MNISQFIYEQIIKNYWNSSIIIRMWVKLCMILRTVILKFCDPIISMKIGKKYLYMNLSHNLPTLMVLRPYYNTAFIRISRFLKEKQGHLHFIDVGANIGDTVSIITDEVEGNFLCIECDEKYIPHLQSNIKNNKNIIYEIGVCDEIIHDGTKISINSFQGTSYVSNKSSCDKILNIVTIDELIKKHNEFLKTNIIKIDTDGFDYKVIRGSEKIINEAKPVIFFELSVRHLLSLGENPLSIFKFLFQKGYREAIFYDAPGIPIIKISIDQIEYISQLINYVYLKESIYDVLLFHDIYADDFKEFYENEKLIFSNKR